VHLHREIAAVSKPASSAALLTAGLLSFAAARADLELGLDELNLRWGTNLDEASVTSEVLAPGLWVMRAAGGAVVVSIGESGVLLVDDQYAKTVGKLQTEIERLGGGPVDYVLNTHGHFDHADGNPFLGARGAEIIAHENARRTMMKSTRLNYGEVYYIQPPYPAEGVPGMTFDRSMQLHYNGQTVSLRYFGPGHTDGDVAVYFEQANVIHVGDLYSGRYPYIDPANGGSLSGLIAICRSILDLVDRDTQIVSGHAPVATIDDFRAYTVMLESVYLRLEQAARQGLDVDQVLASGPTAMFDDVRGNATLFITHAYQTVLAEFE